MKSHRILSHHLLIDFQYQSINCYQLILFGIDFDRLTNSSIAYAGAEITSLTLYMPFQGHRHPTQSKCI